MNSFIFILGIGLQVLLANAESSSNGGKVVMCYYSSWAGYRNGPGKFDVEDIDPFLCTHILYAFAGINPVTHQIKVLDPWNDLEDDWGKGGYNRFTGLKKKNPKLKTLLAVGGWNEGPHKFSEMVSTHENREAFIRSALHLVTKHDFDGLSIDWEFPGGRYQDKENHILFLNQLTSQFNQLSLIVTAAVSPSENIINHGYDVPAMSNVLDYIIVMAYDFHGWWGGHHFTGHNSPLNGSPDEETSGSADKHLNVNFSMNYWHQLGARKDKLIMGIPAYGHGFVLSNPDNHGFYAPAAGPTHAGPYTNQLGFWGYNEFCEMLQDDQEWHIYRDLDMVAPYAVKESLWHGFDDEQSVRKKSEYINENGFGGGMVWSIDTDDFHGICSYTKSSLIHTIAQVLNGGLQSAPPGALAPDSNHHKSTKQSNGVSKDDKFQCPGHGLYAEGNCSPYFYDCVFLTPILMICPANLVFDEQHCVCNYPYQVAGCQGVTDLPSTTTSATMHPTPFPTLPQPTTQLPNASVCNHEGKNPSPMMPCTNMYYECRITDGDQWQVIPSVCNLPGFIFDQETLECKDKDDVQSCQDITT